MYYESNYLAHHGVKGMKWGVRHDPERTGRRPKLQRYETSDRKQRVSNKEDPKQHRSLTEKQKRNIAIGAAAAGTILAVYGGRKASKMLKEKAGRKSLEQGKEIVNRYRKQVYEHLDIGNPYAARTSLNNMERTSSNLYARTKQVQSSTRDAVRYLRKPEYYNIDGAITDWDRGIKRMPKDVKENIRYGFKTGSDWVKKNKHLFT